MRLYLVCSVTVLAFGLCAAAQEPPAPKTFPPETWLASAVKKDKVVAVKITPLAREAVVSEKDGVVVTKSVMMWGKPVELELGKKVQAIRLDGTAASPDEVLKALAKPAGVACFLTWPGFPAKPDPFYLSVLKPGSVVLVIEEKDIFSDPVPDKKLVPDKKP